MIVDKRHKRVVAFDPGGAMEGCFGYEQDDCCDEWGYPTLTDPQHALAMRNKWTSIQAGELPAGEERQREADA